MANNNGKGLFEIVIPPSAECKRLNILCNLLNNKNELFCSINQNIYNFNNSQLTYLKSLLNLEVSVFDNDKLNQNLIGNPLFCSVVRYNLYEGIMKILKGLNNIEQNKIEVKIELPHKNWLNVWGYSHNDLLAFPLLEIENAQGPVVEITIYESKGYTNEWANILAQSYRNQGKHINEIDFLVEEQKNKKEMIKCIADTFLKYWNLSIFMDELSYDVKVKGKVLSWARIYKQDIDD